MLAEGLLLLSESEELEVAVPVDSESEFDAVAEAMLVPLEPVAVPVMVLLMEAEAEEPYLGNRCQFGFGQGIGGSLDVRLCSVAVGDVLLVDAVAARVGWAVVVAGQDVVALLAEAVPVVGGAGVELGRGGLEAAGDDAAGLR